MIDVGGVRLVTDPLLARHAGVLRRRGGVAPTAADWAGADAVLLSHLHHDHAHVPSLRSTAAVVLGPPSTAHWASGHGLPAVGLHAGEWWHAAASEPPRVSVRTVRAVHGHRPMPHRPNPAVGFVVLVERPDDHNGLATGPQEPRDRTRKASRTGGEGGVVRIWFAGDTEYYPEMERIPEWAGGPIDLALVPVGGWGPRLSGGHMGPDDAALACRAVAAARAVPIHWGTLHAPLGSHLPRGWMDRAGEEFAAVLAVHAPECDGVVLRPGERLAL